MNKYKSVSNPELVTQEIQAFDAIWEAIQGLTGKQLEDNNLYERIAHYTYEHYNEDAVDIRNRFRSPVKR